MQKILITGAKGQLGLELTKRLQQKNNTSLILTDVEELDITDINAVQDFVKQNNPSLIINCAAYTAVDNCETNKDTAFKINAIGPKNLSLAGNEIGAGIVHISTDYVFDGNGIKKEDGNIRPYIESDETNPQSVYGESKLQGEIYVKEMNPKNFIIRTAWLYGDGQNFVNTMLKLAKERDTLKVVNDQIGNPTSARALAEMIEHLIKTDNYGLYHGTCEGTCTWYDFAKEIFKIKGININVIPVSTEEFPRPAKRPKYSVLENYMLKQTGIYKFPDWKEEIKKFLSF